MLNFLLFFFNCCVKGLSHSQRATKINKLIRKTARAAVWHRAGGGRRERESAPEREKDAVWAG